MIISFFKKILTRLIKPKTHLEPQGMELFYLMKERNKYAEISRQEDETLKIIRKYLKGRK